MITTPNSNTLSCYRYVNCVPLNLMLKWGNNPCFALVGEITVRPPSDPALETMPQEGWAMGFSWCCFTSDTSQSFGITEREISKLSPTCSDVLWSLHWGVVISWDGCDEPAVPVWWALLVKIPLFLGSSLTTFCPRYLRWWATPAHSQN